MEKKSNRNRIGKIGKHRRKQWPLTMRVLAMMLAMAMILTSSGMQVLAAEVKTDTEAVTEQVVDVDTAAEQITAVSSDETASETQVGGVKTESETTAHETTAPETAAPETAAPETTAPETIAPETTAPETTAPETTVPETAAPETAAPETIAPETTAPETIAPETTAPETTELETTASETTAPEATAPETAAPETAESEMTDPETAVSEVTVPETEASQSAAPETLSSETDDSETNAPETMASEVNEPEAAASETVIQETITVSQDTSETEPTVVSQETSETEPAAVSQEAQETESTSVSQETTEAEPIASEPEMTEAESTAAATEMTETTETEPITAATEMTAAPETEAIAAASEMTEAETNAAKQETTAPDGSTAEPSDAAIGTEPETTVPKEQATEEMPEETDDLEELSDETEMAADTVIAEAAETESESESETETETEELLEEMETETADEQVEAFTGTAVSYTVRFTKLINDKCDVLSKGRTLAEKKFDFKLTPDSSNSYPTWTDEACTSLMGQADAVQTGGGDGAFSPMYFNQAGTYSYILSEADIRTNDGILGYTKDNSVYQITIKVTEDGENGLTILPTDATYQKVGEEELHCFKDNRPVFNNICSDTTEVAVPDGTKTLIGREIKDDESFSFTVYEKIGNEMHQTTVNGVTTDFTEENEISTAKIVFDNPLTYDVYDLRDDYGYDILNELYGDGAILTYVIREIDCGEGHMDCSPEEITFTVRVYYDDAGYLKADLNLPTGGINFTNTYYPDSVSYTIPITKRILKESELRSEISLPKADVDVSGPKVDADELNTDSDTNYPMALSLDGDEDGTDSAAVGTAAEKIFDFRLEPDTDTSNTGFTDPQCQNPIPTEGITTSIQGAGSGRFKLYFNEAGTYSYHVTEEDIRTNDGILGYTKNNSRYLVTITVDDIDDTLTVTDVSLRNVGIKLEFALPEGSSLPFTNIYHDIATVSLPNGTKILEGGRETQIRQNEFYFDVYEISESGEETFLTEGMTLNGEACEDGSSKADIQFYSELTYSPDDIGLHKYVIREYTGNDEHIEYSTEEIEFTVKVYFNDSQYLTADLTLPEDGITFINAYHTSACYAVPVSKKINGGDSRDGKLLSESSDVLPKSMGFRTYDAAIDSNKEFSFTLVPYTYNKKSYTDSSCTNVIPETGITATVNGANKGSFDKLYFNKAGTYIYTLTENKLDNPEGYTTDDTKYTILIKVAVNPDNTSELYIKEATFQSDELDGTEIRSWDVPVFDNTFSQVGSYQIPVQKMINGKADSDSTETFRFTLIPKEFDDQYNSISYTDQECTQPFKKGTLEITGAGTAKFDSLYFQEEGWYYFTLTEDDIENPERYEKDSREITIVLKVWEDENTHLMTVYEAGFTSDTKQEDLTLFSDDSPVVFDNTYYQAASCEIPVKKTINGSDSFVSSKAFSFTLTPITANGNPVSYTDEECTKQFADTTDTLQITGTGTKSFAALYFDHPGTYSYTLKEDQLKSADGFTTESRECYVTIVVGKDTTDPSKLVVSSAYYFFEEKALESIQFDQDQPIVFNNTYAAAGTAELVLIKVLTGNRAKKLQGEEFTFELKEKGSDTAIAAAKNDENGIVTFSISYSAEDIGQTYHYEIDEIDDEKTAIVYSKEKVEVDVAVSDDPEHPGQLKTDITYTPEDATFTNEYQASGSFTPKATKVLTGNRALAIGAGEFTFRVTENDEEVATGETLAGGNVKFTPIEYTQDDIGIHTYVITENAGDDESISYTASPVTLTVEVSDAGDGKLSVDAEYPEDGIQFVNEYHAKGFAELSAVKELIGSSLQKEQFTFELKDADGNVLQTKKNDADGNVTFDALEYTEDDIGQVLTYTVSEVDSQVHGITYSAAVYTVQVTVTDNADGTLTVETEITEDGNSAENMLFTNSFAGTVSLLKIGPDGERLKDAEFELYQKTEDGWELYTEDNEDGIYTTGEEGLLEVTDLSENEYYFIEAVAPDGYITATEPDGSVSKYTFKIGLNDPEAVVDAKFEIPNDKTSVEILKQDETGAPVSGAVLRIIDSDGNKIDEWTTDGNAHEVTGILVGGQTYRLIEVSAPAGYRIAADMTFTVKADGQTDPIIMIDETIDTAEAYGAAQVTKRLVMSGEPMAADYAVFYTALFEDADCTRRVSDIRALEFENTSSSTVIFENLEPGKTYYAAETDANGLVMNQGMLLTGELYAAQYTDGQELTAEENETAELTFTNTFFSVPTGYYLEGELTITKELLSTDGEDMESDEIFYAGIFADASFETLSNAVSQNIVAINMDGASQASTVVRVVMPESGTITLYVTEVDENGIPVETAEDFPYEVSVSETEVTLTTDEYAAEVIITNSEIPEEETEPETKEARDSEPTTEPETTPATEPETTVETESETTAETESETTAETESETTVETESETTVETESETTVETESETTVETESETTVETESETTVETESETTVETESETTAETESETTPAATTTTSTNTPSGTSTTTQSVKTGDSTPITLYTALFAAAAITLLIVAEKRRRRKNKNV